MQDQKITIEEIENKEFHLASRGYNQHEVDEFLDSICDELERQENEIAALREENNRLQNQAVPQSDANQMPIMQMPNATEGTFREILEMAQRVKEMTIADAEAKAAEIIENAENEVKACMGNLGEEKERLASEVENLRKAAHEYKEKFAAMISVAQEALDLTSELD